MSNAFGVAVFGSALASGYHAVLADRTRGLHLRSSTLTDARESVGHALQAAGDLSGRAGTILEQAARDGYVHGMSIAVAIGATTVAFGAAVAARYLPARGTHEHPPGEHVPIDLDLDLVIAAQEAEPAGLTLTTPADDPR
jgi:DHA2 family multidrug resistance protein-like MFS transporter